MDLGLKSKDRGKSPNRGRGLGRSPRDRTGRWQGGVWDAAPEKKQMGVAFGLWFMAWGRKAESRAAPEEQRWGGWGSEAGSGVQPGRKSVG